MTQSKCKIGKQENLGQNYFYRQMHILLNIWNVKIYIKIPYIHSYVFRSIWTILRELTLSLAKVTLL